MAILPKNINTLPSSTGEVYPVSIKEYAIGGKLIVMNMKLSAQDSVAFSSDKVYKETVKQKIVTQLVQELIRQKLVEVTFRNDPISYDTMITVRAYLAPDEQVKILRQMHVPKVAP